MQVNNDVGVRVETAFNLIRKSNELLLKMENTICITNRSKSPESYASYASNLLNTYVNINLYIVYLNT